MYSRTAEFAGIMWISCNMHGGASVCGGGGGVGKKCLV